MIVSAKETFTRMAMGGLLLGGFAVLGAGLVSLTHQATYPVIRHNERAALQHLLGVLIPSAHYDNPVTEDIIDLQHPLLGSDEPITIHRAFRDGAPVAAFATPVAMDGYSGPIRLLVATYADGTIGGVRILSHRETPGLGDAIEAERSDWIHGFSGRSLGTPPLEDWAVTRDGGAFDQFTGATITPRAVVRAVRDWLLYFEDHRDAVFANPLETPP